MNWEIIFLIVTGAAMLFFLYRSVKNNPELFSAASITKSFGTMGLVALALIAFVAVLVWMTRV